jgi:hypothetical protein
MSNILKFRKLSVVTVLIAVLTLAACQQANLDPAGGGSAALNAAKSAQGVGVPPTQWTSFTPLPFAGISGIPTVSGLATDGSYLVATGFDGSVPYVERYNSASGWTARADLKLLGLTIKPGAAHYLNGTYLITGGSTSNTGVYSADASTNSWYTTGNIGFGSKAAVYGTLDELYVVAGQFGQAAYASSLDPSIVSNFTTIPYTITGWPNSTGAAYINTGVYSETDNIYVFGGGSGRIAYTSDITNLNPNTGKWTAATGTTATNYPFPNNGFVNAMAYDGNTTIVAGGNTATDAGILAISTNSGQTWRASTAATTEILSDTIYAVAYAYVGGQSYFVAVNDSGNFAWSPNGDNWINGTGTVFVPSASNTGVNVAVFYANTFFAGGGDPSGMKIARSN